MTVGSAWFSAGDWSAIGLSIQVSLLSMLLMLPPGVLVAVWLARGPSPRAGTPGPLRAGTPGPLWVGRGGLLRPGRWSIGIGARRVVEIAVMLPLVVPPVATGFALLQLMLWMHVPLAFTRWAACIAGAVVGAPLLIRTVRAAVEQIDPRLGQVAATLGASRLRVLVTITLPLAWRGIVGGATLAWARALGEFGATVIVAGDMPGETRTIPLAIWSAHQTGKPVLGLIAASVVLAACAIGLAELLIRGGRAGSARHATPPSPPRAGR